MSLTILMISIFLVGIFFVALEDKLGVNKSATALLMSVVMWVVLSLSGGDVSADVIAEQLGEVSETLFFVMGALLIVEVIDIHGGFRVINQAITTNSPCRLLWIIAILTFLLSAILDNIATAVIMIALVRKFVEANRLRWIFSGIIILAANAGGSFSPVGDVTTILLWTGNNLTPEHQISSLLLPSIVAMIVPLIIVSQFYIKRDERLSISERPVVQDNNFITRLHRGVILFLGVSTMALVPFFQEWSTLPPFMRILMGLAVLWIYTDCMYGRIGDVLPASERHTVGNMFSRIDMSTIMFFLGILMSVGAMKVAGVLGVVGSSLESSFGDPLLISFVIGVMSSFVDNVALVAATQGMYPVSEVGVYATNSEFWTFLAYCAVNGGSLLIIGSATGVTVMGIEKLSFGYYLKRFSLLAILSYLSGAGIFLLFS